MASGQRSAGRPRRTRAGADAPPLRVAIHGYYGFRNAGDEAILAVILAELARQIPNVQPVVISADPAWSEKLHGIPAVDAYDLERTATCVRESDLVISGGGGLFGEYDLRSSAELLGYPAGGLASYGQVPLLAKLYGKPLALLAHGIGPIRSRETSNLVRFVFRLADRVTLRDEASRGLLAELGCADKVAAVAPDPAFAFPLPSRQLCRRFLETRIGPLGESPLLAVCVRVWDRDKRFVAKVSKALDTLLAETDARIVFVPFQRLDWYDDLATAEKVLKRMQQRDRCTLLDARTPDEVAKAIGGCDAVLAMRLHSVIFGLLAGLPVVALVYDPKVSEMMGRVGRQEDALPLASLEPAELAARLRSLFEPGAAISVVPAQTVSKLRRDVHAHFAGLAELAAAVEPLPAGLDATTPPAPEDHHRARRAAEEKLAARAEEAASLAARLAEREEELRTFRAHLGELATKTKVMEAEFRAYVENKEAHIAALTSELKRTRAMSVRPLLSLANRARRKAIRLVKKFLRRYLPRPLVAFYRELRREEVPHEYPGRVTVYYDEANAFPDHPLRRSLAERGDAPRLPASLVITVRNEARSAPGWIDSLLKQTRAPDDLVIVDGGSTDGTPAIFEEFAGGAPFPTRVIAAGPVNIAQGRNIGVRQAAHSIIACTDLGCLLDPRWLERLVAPFEMEGGTMVSAGWYEPATRSLLGRAAASHTAPESGGPSPHSFLPSSRSLAFKKEAWAAVGGYPEWLTLTGEDTLFSLELARCCPDWALVPEATVRWQAPDGFLGNAARFYRWCIGDGEAGAFARRYWDWLKRSVRDLSLLAVAAAGAGLAFVFPWLAIIPGLALAAVVLFLARAALSRRRRTLAGRPMGAPLALLATLVAPPIRWACVAGFVRGVMNRPRVLPRRIGEVKGVAVILSGVPITDTGGGQRPAQLALEFLRQGHLVVYINMWESYESRDLKIRMIDQRLLTYPAHAFDFEAFMRRHQSHLQGKPLLAILEHPVGELARIAADVQAAGGTALYDLLDDWSTSLGAGFYTPEVEQAVIDSSDVLVATAAPLKEHLERASGRAVALVPNAVNTRIFNRDNDYPRPADLAEGEFVACYVGALWGEWFDWTLLRKIALAYPRATVAVIGDYRGQCPAPPANLHFLGLKAQSELPAYLTHSDVAIIPWVISAITQAVSPLKLYEYLAMGKPVVAPRIGELEGIPYVLLSNDDGEFIANIGKARKLKVDPQVIAAFVDQNSWSQRVATILELARRDGSPLQPGNGKS